MKQQKNNDTSKKPLVYLDSAATAQKPQMVIDAIKNYLENEYGTVHRGAYGLSAKSSFLYEQTRQTVASFLGLSHSESVIFTRGTTESLNILAHGLAETVLTEDSRIVLPAFEHHSNLIPWQQAALKTSCELAYLKPQGKSGALLSLNLEEAKKLITKNTKVVTLAHMGNVLGQINPLPDIIQLAKQVNAFVIIDSAQSVTCLDSSSLFKMGADAVVFSGHKFYGPTGIGVLALSPALLDILPPLMFGGAMVSQVTLEESTWAPAPACFEAGTPPITEAIALNAAFEWIKKVGGPKAIHAHASSLNSRFIEGLKQIGGLELYSQETGHEVLVSFRSPKMHAHDFVTYLDSYGICMRAGHHCAWPLIQFLGVDALVRASFAAYNNVDDVDYTLQAIKEIVKKSF